MVGFFLIFAYFGVQHLFWLYPTVGFKVVYGNFVHDWSLRVLNLRERALQVFFFRKSCGWHNRNIVRATYGRRSVYEQENGVPGFGSRIQNTTTHKDSIWGQKHFLPTVRPRYNASRYKAKLDIPPAFDLHRFPCCYSFFFFFYLYIPPSPMYRWNFAMSGNTAVFATISAILPLGLRISYVHIRWSGRLLNTAR